MNAGPNAIVARIKNSGMVKINVGPRLNIPPRTPPLKTKERPSEKAAREIAKSLNSISEKCQNDPLCRVGGAWYDWVNPRLNGENCT